MGFTDETSTVVPPKFGGGPHGIGDPEDKTLRRVEKEVLIPKIMREQAKLYNCSEEVKQFETCCKANSLMMIFFCRKQNDVLKDCLNKWYQDEKFKSECQNIYLNDRTEYRLTGILKKHRTAMANQKARELNQGAI